ncbi:flavin reductase family protein [Venatoribacter cucullus]|uniref:flavin reductase family protein n=1 Tax=Venatoribacter cucullus TaxID=2661630 RepID=UPI00223FEF9F|nr:flavin reductase family protein [Venatoribacter cucullus]
MQIAVKDLDPVQNYHLLIQTVLPRPIAWILTANVNEASDGRAGAFNLAPYSFFAPVCAEPPTLVVSIGKKPAGPEKDTYVNLQRDGRCVVHIASVDDLPALNDSSATLDYGVSEIERQGLALCAEPGWSLPRLQQAPVAFLCRYQQQVDIGPQAQHLVFLEVEQVWLNDDIATTGPRLQVDAAALNPLARLGGSEYASLGELMKRPRPA